MRADIEREIFCDLTPVKGAMLGRVELGTEEQAESEILEGIESGERLAWCVLRVTVRWEGYVATRSIGQQSFYDIDDAQWALACLYDLAMHDIARAVKPDPLSQIAFSEMYGQRYFGQPPEAA